MNSDDKKLLALGLIVALLSIGGPAVLSRIPRGIRNNNPGNIRRTGIQWLGEVPDAEKTDGEFEQFLEPVFGIRALAREIRTGLGRGQTLAEFIAEQSPASENDTARYIERVAAATGLAPDQIPPIAAVPALVAAITVEENGVNPYSAALIDQGVRMGLAA